MISLPETSTPTTPPTDIQNLIKSVETQNPWHIESNFDWFSKDGSLRDVIKAESEGFYEPSKTFYYIRKNFFDPIFSDINKWGVFVMLGPRRIGKTSTLKYMIKKLIEEGRERKSFVYVSLDQDEMFLEDVGKKRILKEFLTAIIDKYKTQNKPLIIILDEVTFYKGWARSIKNLVDSGKIGPGIALIATGSYSLDLSSAKRELDGRYGPLGDAVKGEVFFYPKRFIEVAESLLGDKFRTFVRDEFGRTVKRIGIIEYLSGVQNEEDSTKYGYRRILNKLFNNFYDDLHGIFENFYIKTGGYPRIIHDAIISQRLGKTSVEDARYLQDIFGLFTSDSIKFELTPLELKKILSNIKLPCMQISQDYSTLGSSLVNVEIKKYIDYLETSGFVSFLRSISDPKDIDQKSQLIQPSGDRIKLVINDPACFFAIFLASRGINANIFTNIENIIGRDNNVIDFLFEAIVLSHLKHIPIFHILSTEKQNIGYILDHDSGQEYDGFCWYVNFKSELVLIAIEVKRTENLNGISERAKLLKSRYGIKRLIVISNQKNLTIEEDYAIIPIEIFLSLL